MSPEYITHVTLDTGHSRTSPRSEVSDEAVARVQDMLNRVFDGEIVEVMNGCILNAASDGNCLLASVWFPFRTAPPRAVPLVTIGIAVRSRGGARLWRLLHDGAVRAPDEALATSRDTVPQEPWCAARLEPGLAMFPEESHWLGDFERCLAWAWIERPRA